MPFAARMRHEAVRRAVVWHRLSGDDVHSVHSVRRELQMSFGAAVLGQGVGGNAEAAAGAEKAAA
jgi:hypothetical protein